MSKAAIKAGALLASITAGDADDIAYTFDHSPYIRLRRVLSPAQHPAARPVAQPPPG
jgi:hypothetical protein